MGVPKFYRWLSERYPRINRAVGGADGEATPVVDNLYLDMNGVIHNCARPGADARLHPDGKAPTLSEEDMFMAIFRYIDQLFALMTPRKLLFMAVDGVAPRAKMNQQRSRRFRSAAERENDAKASEFDSNCITPGTQFMARLSEALLFLVHRKMADDARWRAIEVIVSGAEVPGEGEHKIMDYIRHNRNTPKIPPNTRHCMYGLDADLIMLSLLTHEPHFVLLREKVDFAAFRKKKNNQRHQSSLDTQVTGQFELLSIGVLRQYLDIEFRPLDVPFYDLERVIDDFILMCFLVGNDFLPNLPTMDIRDGALPAMMRLYMKLIPRFGGYLNDSGEIHFDRLQIFLSKLGLLEPAILLDKEQAAKRSGRAQRSAPSTLDNLDFELVWGFDTEASASTWSMVEMSSALRESIGISEMTSEDRLKSEYYQSKLQIQSTDPNELRPLVSSYVQGLMWTLGYYYKGCQSWRWFYPYHYAPLASDLVNIADIARETAFVVGCPFLPMQQLLSVLPPASSWCLPAPYQDLMLNPASPLADFFPKTFGTDLNGKRNDWEAVVLLPFVDEERLLGAISTIPESKISPTEKKRNTLGHAWSFSKDHSVLRGSSTRRVSSPFTKLSAVESDVSPIPLPTLTKEARFTARLSPGTKGVEELESLDSHPTLSTAQYTGRHSNVGINVFGTSSRAESVVLDVERSSNVSKFSSADEAQSFGVRPGARVYVDYPWKCEAYVVSVCDHTREYSIASSSLQGEETAISAVSCKLDAKQTDRHNLDLVALGDELCTTQGIRVDEPAVIAVVLKSEAVDAQTGRAISFHERESKAIADLLLVPSKQVPPPVARNTLQVGQQVLYVGPGPFHGRTASILKQSDPNTKSAQIMFEVPAGAAQEVAFGLDIARTDVQHGWSPVSVLAKKMGCPVGVLLKFLGSARFTASGKKEREDEDIGLGLMFSRRGLCVPGYCRLENKSNNSNTRPTYLYSVRALNILRTYREKFPVPWEIIDLATRTARSEEGEQIFDISSRLPGKSGLEYITKIRRWIAELECTKLPLLKASSSVLSRDAVCLLEKKATEAHKALQMNSRSILSGVLPGREGNKPRAEEIVAAQRTTKFENRNNLSSGLSSRPGEQLQLGDRVVYQKSVGSVPFGARGSIVGLHMDAPEGVEVVFDVPFIGGTSLHHRCSEARGKAVPASSLIKVRVARFEGGTIGEALSVPGRSYAGAAGKTVTGGRKKNPILTRPENLSMQGQATTRPVTQQPSAPSSSVLNPSVPNGDQKRKAGIRPRTDTRQLPNSAGQMVSGTGDKSKVSEKPVRTKPTDLSLKGNQQNAGHTHPNERTEANQKQVANENSHTVLLRQLSQQPPVVDQSGLPSNGDSTDERLQRLLRRDRKPQESAMDDQTKIEAFLRSHRGRHNKQ